MSRLGHVRAGARNAAIARTMRTLVELNKSNYRKAGHLLKRMGLAKQRLMAAACPTITPCCPLHVPLAFFGRRESHQNGSSCSLAQRNWRRCCAKMAAETTHVTTHFYSIAWTTMAANIDLTIAGTYMACDLRFLWTVVLAKLTICFDSRLRMWLQPTRRVLNGAPAVEIMPFTYRVFNCGLSLL